MRDWDMKADFSLGLLHAERRKIAERYARRMMPRIHATAAEVKSGDTSVLEWIREQAHANVSPEARARTRDVA